MQSKWSNRGENENVRRVHFSAKDCCILLEKNVVKTVQFAVISSTGFVELFKGSPAQFNLATFVQDKWAKPAFEVGRPNSPKSRFSVNFLNVCVLNGNIEKRCF